MKKISSYLAFVGITSLACVHAHAQSKFEGAFGQIGIGYESVAPSFSNSNFYN